MTKGALALFLLFLLAFASHGVSCAAAARSAMAEEDATHHDLRPHHHEAKVGRIQAARKVGRVAGGSGAGSGGGRNTGGGTTDTRPHNAKNGGAVPLPAAATSALALIITTTVLLSAHSF
uniref:Predicted protein n=1 Tax=Hordeum vulgare subsp. vulgare TaxID=112509 RepID=F2CS05_HORVV|nr:predicted protein [Hordeum vulgare subsp. vulgare]